MADVILLLGANLGNKALMLEQAIEAIHKEVGEVQEISSTYKTPAWGFESGNDFYNQVVIISTKLEPIALLEKLKTIELQLGRDPLKKSIDGVYQDRFIDIDILFYDRLILETAELSIPHPRLHLRKFTLVPLAELKPELEHPLLKKSIQTLLMDCPDNVIPERLS